MWEGRGFVQIAWELTTGGRPEIPGDHPWAEHVLSRMWQGKPENRASAPVLLDLFLKRIKRSTFAAHEARPRFQ